jgi:hypothetical protein
MLQRGEEDQSEKNITQSLSHQSCPDEDSGVASGRTAEAMSVSERGTGDGDGDGMIIGPVCSWRPLRTNQFLGSEADHRGLAILLTSTIG